MPASLIDAYGAVSEPVAVAMAEGVRERTGADVCVGHHRHRGTRWRYAAEAGGHGLHRRAGAVRAGAGPDRLTVRQPHSVQVQRDAGGARHGPPRARRGRRNDVRLFVGLELDERGPPWQRPPQLPGSQTRLIERRARFQGPLDSRFEPPHHRLVLRRDRRRCGGGPDRAAARPLRVTPFELAVRGCGAFPRSGPPRVLWIGTAEGTTAMVAAHAALARRLAPLDHLPETRAYAPHVTMARVKEPGRAARAVRQALADESGRLRAHHRRRAHPVSQPSVARWSRLRAAAASTHWRDVAHPARIPRGIGAVRVPAGPARRYRRARSPAAAMWARRT